MKRETKVILLSQAKGGSGKTTTAVLIVWWLARRGKKVLLIDGDPNHDAEDWFKDAEKHGLDIDFTTCERDEDIAPMIKAAQPNYDTIVVDTPGFKSQIMIYAAPRATAVLLPVMPSRSDLKHFFRVKTSFEGLAVSIDREIPLYAVLTSASNTEMTAQTRQAIVDSGIPLVGELAQSTGFREFVSNAQLPSGAARVSAGIFLNQLEAKGVI